MKQTDILFSSAIEGLNTVRVSSDKDIWFCILDFECQEMKEDYDDLILMFPSSNEMQAFLTKLEETWVSKQKDLFPMSILDEEDELSVKCTNIYLDLSRSWEPLISAAMF
uniref:Uncharacterized protein n=1 Tax=Megaselia scalaris TaxID=36166 RepID=T1GJL1_MEGSC